MRKRALLLVVTIALAACQPRTQGRETVTCAAPQSCLDFGECDDGLHYAVECDESSSPTTCRCVVGGVVGNTFELDEDVGNLCVFDVSGCDHFSNAAQDCLDDTFLGVNDNNRDRVNELCGFAVDPRPATIAGFGRCVLEETLADDVDDCDYHVECPAHTSFLACGFGSCQCDSDQQHHTDFSSTCAALSDAVNNGNAEYIETNCDIDGVVF